MHVRRRLPRVAAVALGLMAVATAGASAATAPTRYTLANGCYTLQSPSGQVVAGGDRVRMQATTLASYLLYRPDRTFLAAQGNGSVAPDQRPSPAADWRVKEAPGGTFTLSPASAPGRVLNVRFVPAQGCASFPEAELNATGTPRPGQVPYGRVGGIVEGHMHWMTFEYLGGQLPLRPPVASVRDRVTRCRTAPRSRVRRAPRRRPRTSSTTATPPSPTTRAAIPR